jgi:peptidoglycan lytic transglycosylase
MRIPLRELVATGTVALALLGCAQAPVQNEPPAAPSPPESSAPLPASTPAPEPARDTGPHVTERGRVSLYGAEFAGRTTASGERFDPNALTMAHRTLPFGTVVRVTNVENQKSVEVTVNDRGPFVPGRIADLSLGAARKLGMVADGVVDAILEVIRPGPLH